MNAQITAMDVVFVSRASVCVPKHTLVNHVKSSHGAPSTATATECVKRSSACASLASLANSASSVCPAPTSARSAACVTTMCACAIMAGKGLIAHNLSIALPTVLDMEIARQMPACATVDSACPIVPNSFHAPWTAFMESALDWTVCVIWVLLALLVLRSPLAARSKDAVPTASVTPESSVYATKIIMGIIAKKNLSVQTNVPTTATAFGACVCVTRAGMAMTVVQSPIPTIALPLGPRLSQHQATTLPRGI